MSSSFTPSHDRRSRAGAWNAVFALSVLAAAGAGYFLTARRTERPARPRDSAPARTLRHLPRLGTATMGRTVTVNRPRPELYAFWRDFQNLPRFMENIEKIEPGPDGHCIWTIVTPAGSRVTLETEIIEERENEFIAWRTVPSSDVEAHGYVRFADAPAGRGTHVEAEIVYKRPAGEVGRLIARLFHREPAIQIRRELKRFKMFMETGEIATPSNRNGQV